MEIRRFGPGHRRRDPAPGSRGVMGATLWSDPRASVTEVALGPRALLAPHTRPGTTLLVVISGGGWVQCDGERIRIHHGEAVVLPAGAEHGAWTDGTELRMLLVELPDEALADPRVLEGRAEPVAAVGAATGALADRPVRREDHDEAEGEPW